MLYDTHCHPYLQKQKDKKQILETFNTKYPEGFLNSIGTNLETSVEAIEEAKKYSFIKASIGIHPCDIEKLDLETTISKLEELYLENKDIVIAIGECGLDYYRLPPKIQSHLSIQKIKDKQKRFFKAQIKLAQKYDLPIIIHNRESRDDIFKIIKETGLKKFVFHCYSEDLEYAKKLLDLSPTAMISFSGIVTFKNAQDVQETAVNIPLENILAETDAPYLTPVPYRGKEENEPIFTEHVVEKIAELRGEDVEKVRKQIWQNSLRTFKIKN
ncbi:MAG: TatD family hydrolase [Candidatus Gracilibacteria bacterium]|nr:TatD family hydrolase [Candidatus Gracilibacteria bacterium]